MSKYEQLELQLFAHGQIPSKAGTMDIERVGRKVFQYTYWNCVGCIGAVALFTVGEGVHLMDCKNPYDSEGDRKVIEGMAEVKFYTELPF